MKLQALLTVATISSTLLASTLPSMAQTAVGTSNRVRTEVGKLNTTSNLNISEVSNYKSEGEAIANTQTYKIEAYAPNATANIRFDGKKVTGSGTASTNVETDPVVILVTSEATSILKESETKNSTVSGYVAENGSFFVQELQIDANAYLK